MILETVSFDLPASTERETALALYRESAAGWLDNPDLVEKYYVFDAQRGVGGGIYIWRSLEAQQKWHGADYRRAIRARYGSEPAITITDALLRVDPTTRRIETL